MRLSIIISQLTNFLFFVQKTKCNLLNAHSHKYFEDENFSLLFYGGNENQIWKQIEKTIRKKNANRIKKDIQAFRPVFFPHWRQASKHLTLWKQYFQCHQKLFERFIIDAKNLSGIKHFDYSKIPIYLISDPKNNDKKIDAWFSWTPKESFIVVEIPLSYQPPKNVFPVGILVHEFFHLMLRKNKKLFFKLKKIAKENDEVITTLSKGMPNRLFIEELLVSSFVPEGYLSEKYLNNEIAVQKTKPQNLLMWRKFIAYPLYQTAKKYVSNARQIDKDYFQLLIDVIKKT